MCEKVQILGSAPVTATKAPHWRSPWAYCASLLPFRKESDDFGSPRSSVDDVLPPDTGRLSPWAWYLLGPTVAWAMQASKSVGPTVLGCRKAQMVASLMETGKLVDETIADTTQAS